MSDAERLERIVSLACDLLRALQPWTLQASEVRSAATRLTVALAALPLPAAAPSGTGGETWDGIERRKPGLRHRRTAAPERRRATPFYGEATGGDS
jgi:hypothetical protein